MSDDLFVNLDDELDAAPLLADMEPDRDYWHEKFSPDHKWEGFRFWLKNSIRHPKRMRERDRNLFEYEMQRHLAMGGERWLWEPVCDLALIADRQARRYYLTCLVTFPLLAINLTLTFYSLVHLLLNSK